MTSADIAARIGQSDTDGSVLLGCIGVPALIAFAAYMIATPAPSGGGQAAETYRLVHAIDNTEREVARGLSKFDCQIQRDEFKETATALGTYSEATGYGSITCLPESTF